MAQSTKPNPPNNNKKTLNQLVIIGIFCPTQSCSLCEFTEAHNTPKLHTSLELEIWHRAKNQVLTSVKVLYVYEYTQCHEAISSRYKNKFKYHIKWRLWGSNL